MKINSKIQIKKGNLILFCGAIFVFVWLLIINLIKGPQWIMGSDLGYTYLLNGLNILLDTYVELYVIYEQNLVNKKSINWDFLKVYFNELKNMDWSCLITSTEASRPIIKNVLNYKPKFIYSLLSIN